MSDEYELTFEIVEHEKMFEKSLDSILEQPPMSMVPSSEFKGTTTRVSRGVKAGVYILSKTYSIDSWLKVSRLVIEHGFAILMHNNKKLINEIDELHYYLTKQPLNEKDDFYLFMIFDYQNNLNIEEGADKKMSIRIQPKYFNAINKISSIVCFKQVDITRVCIAYSLYTSNNVPDYLKSGLKKTVDDFESKLNSYSNSMKNLKDKVFNNSPIETVQHHLATEKE